jgi:hypothetical protein
MAHSRNSLLTLTRQDLTAHDGLELALTDLAFGVAQLAIVRDVYEVRLGHMDSTVLQCKAVGCSTHI